MNHENTFQLECKSFEFPRTHTTTHHYCRLRKNQKLELGFERLTRNEDRHLHYMNKIETELQIWSRGCAKVPNLAINSVPMWMFSSRTRRSFVADFSKISAWHGIDNDRLDDNFSVLNILRSYKTIKETAGNVPSCSWNVSIART